MVPGKSYRIEDFVEIIWRHKWLLVFPFIIGTVGMFAYSQFLPDRYRAEALILIVPQRVPENFVRPTITSSLNERLSAINAQILSRTRLERIINEFDLYTDERESELMEDVVDQMRRDVNVGLPTRRRRAPPESFTVSYEAEDRQMAMQVTQRLAALFIQENLEDRELQADATSRFLESQLEQARRQLIEHEQRLEAYRSKFDGQLPSQLASNTQMMQNTQTQLRSLAGSMNRDFDRQVILERLIADATNQLSVDASRPIVLSELPPDAPAALRLEAARAGLRNLELRFKAEHPDIIHAKQIITELEEEAEAEALTQPLVANQGEGSDTARRQDPREERISSL